MDDINKTLAWVAAAVSATILTLATVPSRATPGAFADVGEPFFPEFTDPNIATTLEVVDFDEDAGAVIPFQVRFTDGLWTIPSHHNYPADAEDRLARTAAGVIGIVKDDVRSDNMADHAALGVIDPLDETTTALSGRGQRVTLRNENDRVLADFVVGREVDNRPGFRFVRLPDQNRVYAARMDIDLSTQFADWIDTDLLGVAQPDIERIVIADYSIDERTQTIDERDTIELSKVDGTWEGDEAIADDRELDAAQVNALVRAIADLSIVGVRPKPEGVSHQLEQTADGLAIAPADLMSLQSRGYYFTRDGQLRSNEGELRVATTDGVLYTLRFGEVLYGRDDNVSAGSNASDDAEAGPGENRYLFITAELDRDRYPEPPRPENLDFDTKDEAEWTEADRTNRELRDAHDEWSAQIADGEARVAEIEDRFGRWYYVISSESFDAVSPTREALTQEATAPDAG